MSLPGTGVTEWFGSTRVEEDRSFPGVFAVRISGEAGETGQALACWRHVLGRARAESAANLLVFLEMQGATLSEEQLAGLVEQLGLPLLGGLRIALVQRQQSRHRIDEIGTLLAMEHGAGARVFPDEGSALVWLRYGND
jgi:hypothetical protein